MGQDFPREIIHRLSGHVKNAAQAVRYTFGNKPPFLFLGLDAAQLESKSTSQMLHTSLLPKNEAIPQRISEVIERSLQSSYSGLSPKAYGPLNLIINQRDSPGKRSFFSPNLLNSKTPLPFLVAAQILCWRQVGFYTRGTFSKGAEAALGV